MSEPGISLCTYTYNDAELVRELLRSLREWQIRPEEVIVVDDGSLVPFEPEAVQPGLRIIRLERNHGITAAKRAGLSAARGAALLSVDCDTRLAPDWLAVSLPNLLREGVGLAGGTLIHATGRDLVARFLECFGDPCNTAHCGPVEFVPGNAFLMRRSTWREIGGFAAYSEPRCQDHYLCRRLAEKGYTLYSDSRARAVQLRRIARSTMCRRTWAWCRRRMQSQLPPGAALPAYLKLMVLEPMLGRFTIALDRREPLFFYLDLLYMAYAALELIDHALGRSLAPAALRDGFARSLARLFAGTPRLWRLYRADLALLGHRTLMPPDGDEAAWSDFFRFADALRNSGLFDLLERNGVDQLLKEDRGAPRATAWTRPAGLPHRRLQ
jgi:glycosyltransferase involved in cell wall biosynthesis